jgi:hypothetical protein
MNNDMYHPNNTEPYDSYETWTETAYDWMKRWQHHASLSWIPHDPSSAAWSFVLVRPGSNHHHHHHHGTTDGCGTSIPFIDAVLRQIPPRRLIRGGTTPINTLPVIRLDGEYGKTWTLLTLAARFVVKTRPSKFPKLDHQHQQHHPQQHPLPSVIVLDSKHDMTMEKLRVVVRSTLLRDMSTSKEHETKLTQMLEHDMEDCFRRIHIATISDDGAGWIPILECIRYQLLPIASIHPTLLLWDGYLCESYGKKKNDSIKFDIVRQIELLLRECNVMMVLTSSLSSSSSSFLYRKREWERFVTDRIRLDVKQSSPIHSDDHLELEAIVNNNGIKLPCSISSTGILS